MSNITEGRTKLKSSEYKKVQREIVAKVEAVVPFITDLENETSKENFLTKVKHVLEILPQSKNTKNVNVYSRFVTIMIKKLEFYDHESKETEKDKAKKSALLTFNNTTLNYLFKNCNRRLIYKLLQLLGIKHSTENSRNTFYLKVPNTIMIEILKYLTPGETYCTIPCVSLWFNSFSNSKILNRYYTNYFRSNGYNVTNALHVLQKGIFTCYFCKEEKYNFYNQNICESGDCYYHPGTYTLDKQDGYYETYYDGYWTCCSQCDSIYANANYDLSCSGKKTPGCKKAICRPQKLLPEYQDYIKEIKDVIKSGDFKRKET
jgi:hypothetical protein